MKLRTVRMGVPYLVQWETIHGWEYIKLKDVKKNSKPYLILEALSRIDYPKRWSNSPEVVEEGDYEGCLLFASELTAFAFLGAMKIWSTSDINEFEI